MKNNEQTVELLKSIMMVFPINLIETFQNAGRLDGDDVVELCRYAKAVGKTYDALGNEFLARSYKDLTKDIRGFKDFMLTYLSDSSDPDKLIKHLGLEENGV